jgi:hypothetical protein
LAPALLADIKQGWEGLPGTNTLAYYTHSYITNVKSFMTLGQARVGSGLIREYWNIWRKTGQNKDPISGPNFAQPPVAKKENFSSIDTSFVLLSGPCFRMMMFTFPICGQRKIKTFFRLH